MEGRRGGEMKRWRNKATRRRRDGKTFPLFVPLSLRPSVPPSLPRGSPDTFQRRFDNRIATELRFADLGAQWLDGRRFRRYKFTGSAFLHDPPYPLLQFIAPGRICRGSGFAFSHGLTLRRGLCPFIQSGREVEQIDVGVFSRNDYRGFGRRFARARPRRLVMARFVATPGQPLTQGIVVIARSANDRGADQLITATFALHDPISQSGDRLFL
jgi:hypothetical protein